MHSKIYIVPNICIFFIISPESFTNAHDVEVEWEILKRINLNYFVCQSKTLLWYLKLTHVKVQCFSNHVSPFDLLSHTATLSMHPILVRTIADVHFFSTDVVVTIEGAVVTIEFQTRDAAAKIELKMNFTFTPFSYFFASFDNIFVLLNPPHKICCLRFIDA